jgi:hypothetical protein
MTEKNGTAHKAVPKPPPGMDNFDRAMRKLVTVPKDALDAAVKADRRRRAKRKAARRAK